jgi:hypothetical protein
MASLIPVALAVAAIACTHPPREASAVVLRASSYDLVVSRQGCALRVRVTPRGAFHIDRDYPARLVGGAHTWSPAALADTELVFEVAEIAQVDVQARFAVCTDTECRPSVEAIAVPACRAVTAGTGALARSRMCVFNAAPSALRVASASPRSFPAVMKHGVPVEYVVFDDEGHGFTKQKNTIAAQEAYLKFLDTYVLRR